MCVKVCVWYMGNNPSSSAINGSHIGKEKYVVTSSMALSSLITLETLYNFLWDTSLGFYYTDS